ncbi:MAG: murein biosynthesis integral membrane protein MurJ, partial [Casimicrobiaceae bacterium]
MNLLRVVTTVSGMTLLSRVTGLARESIKATAFGAGPAMDAFEAAFRLPNLLRRLFAEGAFSQAFVPILAEYHRRRGEEATRGLVARVAGLLALILFIVSVAGVLAAPWLVYVLASGFAKTPGKVELTAQMIRIMFPYILFISLTSLGAGVLNVYRRFAVPAFTPVLLNLAVVGAAIFAAPYFDPPVVALAWGVAVGGVAQLVFLLRPLAKIAMLARPRIDWRDAGVRRVLRAMGPAVIGVSAAQISALINTQFAAWLGDGRISWITYADRLMEFPSALLGVALGTVLLPSLAKHHSDANPGEYSALLDWGLRLALLLALPAAVALWLLALPMISTLYEYGKFSVNDALQTRDALLGYSVGLPGIILIKILAPGFYARQMLRTPVKVAFVTVVITQAIALTLMWR